MDDSRLLVLRPWGDGKFCLSMNGLDCDFTAQHRTNGVDPQCAVNVKVVPREVLVPPHLDTDEKVTSRPLQYLMSESGHCRGAFCLNARGEFQVDLLLRQHEPSPRAT